MGSRWAVVAHRVTIKNYIINGRFVLGGEGIYRPMRLQGEG